MIHQLLYVSFETRPYSEEDLTDLLDKSRENNKLLGITGMLIYYKKHFLQILEGEKENVLQLFRRIRKDERHQSVILFWDKEGETRSFEDWTMAFVNLNTADVSRLEGFSEFLKNGFQEISEENLTDAQKLLIKCKDLLS